MPQPGSKRSVKWEDVISTPRPGFDNPKVVCAYCDEMDGDDEVDITLVIEGLQVADQSLAIELTNQYL